MLPPRIRTKSGRENAGKRCPAHLRFVRSHACCVAGCQARPIEAAHVRRASNSGVGMKPADRYVVSLCAEHHRESHLGEQTFEAKHGLDLMALSAEFVRRSPHRRKLEEMP